MPRVNTRVRPTARTVMWCANTYHLLLEFLSQESSGRNSSSSFWRFTSIAADAVVPAFYRDVRALCFALLCQSAVCALPITFCRARKLAAPHRSVRIYTTHVVFFGVMSCWVGSYSAEVATGYQHDTEKAYQSSKMKWNERKGKSGKVNRRCCLLNWIW